MNKTWSVQALAAPHNKVETSDARRFAVGKTYLINASSDGDIN